MDLARALGPGTALALSFLDRAAIDFAPPVPYCIGSYWSLDPLALGVLIGVVLFPLLELLVACRICLHQALLRRLSPAPRSRPLYRVLDH